MHRRSTGEDKRAEAHIEWGDQCRGVSITSINRFDDGSGKLVRQMLYLVRRFPPSPTQPHPPVPSQVRSLLLCLFTCISLAPVIVDLTPSNNPPPTPSKHPFLPSPCISGTPAPHPSPLGFIVPLHRPFTYSSPPPDPSTINTPLPALFSFFHFQLLPSPPFPASLPPRFSHCGCCLCYCFYSCCRSSC